MKVTLIEAPRFTFPLNHASNVVTPPLGIAYIAATLEHAGYQVQVVDAVGEGMTQYTAFGPIYLRGLTFKQIVDRIDRDTDMIGVSNMFSCAWLATRILLAEIRKAFPNKPIIMGGEHPTGMPELVMSQSPVDVIVVGEGEETVLDLAKHGATGGPSLDKIPGICYRRDGRFVKNPARERIRSIDEIPPPAWHLFRIDDYIELGQPHGAVKGRFMPMLATRGCPYKCTFCTSPQMWTQRWLARDHRKVVDEMESYIAKYGATDFHFEDLTAVVRKRWMIDFGSEILRRGLKVTYQLPSGTRSEAIGREVAKALIASGCSDFPVAPESGDERILKAIDKKVDLDKLFKAADEAIAEGISVTCNFIFGFPEDDWRSLFNLYKAVIRCGWHGFSGVNVNAYSPQPNTESFRALVKAGKIGELDDKYFLSLFTFQSFFVKKTSYNERFSAWMLTGIIVSCFFLFYTNYFLFRPSRLVDLVRSFFVKTTVNKTTTYARSMARELKRIREFRKSLAEEHRFGRV